MEVVENSTMFSGNAGSFELAWRYMTDNYSRLQIITVISALVHFVSYFVICTPSIMFQFIPFLDSYKIQKDKPTTFAAQWKCLKLLFFSQLIIQPPFYIGAYFYVELMNISFAYEDIPSWYKTLAQCFGCLVIEDTWHYFCHRAMHHKSLYKHVHKVHHTFTAPFGMIAEYTHPVETLLLGMGVMWGILLFGTHLIFIWTWMLIRPVELIDVHSGYHIPLNPLHLFPFYGGAKFHDFHHMTSAGNFASTFIWWDKILGTDVDYRAHLEHQSAKKEK